MYIFNLEALEALIENGYISQQEKELVIFEDSAHYPQFEESDKFYEWLCEKFISDEQ